MGHGSPSIVMGVPVTDTKRLPGCTEELWQWQLHAECRGMDSSVFFSPDTERGPRRRRREAAAKAICAHCPVLAACRDHALQVQEPYGIWGGLTENERTGRLTLAGSVREGAPGAASGKSISAATVRGRTATAVVGPGKARSASNWTPQPRTVAAQTPTS
jgi:WhiB family redox-sensing transcriptional regulator